MRGFVHLKIMEHKNGENACTYHTDENPGLEFTPSRFCVINYRANEGVNNSVKGAKKRKHHADDTKVFIREGNYVGKVHEKVHTYKRVKRVTSYGTKTEANFIACDLFIIHFLSPLFFLL